RRARCLEGVERLRVGVLQVVEQAALGVVWLDGLRNPLDRPVRQPRGLPATEVGFDVPGAASGAASVATASGAASCVAAAIAAGRTDRGIGPAIAERVSAEHAVVKVVVGVRPERVIRVWVEGVIDEIVVGVWPEQRADPADHNREGGVAPPLWVEEPALEGRVRQRARAGIAGGSKVGKSLVAQHAAGEGAWVAGRSRAGGRRRN